jgi:hypothetical protein
MELKYRLPVLAVLGHHSLPTTGGTEVQADSQWLPREKENE